MVEEISECEFTSLEHKPLAVIDFYAEWCMPCVVQGPVMDEIASKFLGKIHFVKVNVDDCNKLAQKFKVMSIPTIVVLKQGKEIGRMVGMQQAEILEEKMRKFLCGCCCKR